MEIGAHNVNDNAWVQVDRRIWYNKITRHFWYADDNNELHGPYVTVESAKFMLAAYISDNS